MPKQFVQAFFAQLLKQILKIAKKIKIFSSFLFQLFHKKIISKIKIK